MQDQPVAAEDSVQGQLRLVLNNAASSAGAVLDSYRPRVDEHFYNARAALHANKVLLDRAKAQLLKKEWAAQSVSDAIASADPLLNVTLAEAQNI